MKAGILAFARIAVPPPDNRPEFRRATFNMRLCAAALECLFSQAPAAAHPRCGLALATCFGELEATKDFLATLTTQGVARPLLFQNSLHNATIGFLSLHFKIQGPTATLSDRIATGHHALTTALLWISAGLVETAIAIECDSAVADLPHEALKHGGATALLLKRADSSSKMTVTIEAGAPSQRDPLGWLCASAASGVTDARLPFSP